MSQPVYPLIEHSESEIKTASGRELATITLDAVRQGELSLDDIRISRETLLAQAGIAQQAGFPQLATNLTRAAELTIVPNEEILAIYEKLRPRRSSYPELIALAERLEQVYNAAENARLVRQAAAVYQGCDLLRND